MGAGAAGVGAGGVGACAAGVSLGRGNGRLAGACGLRAAEFLVGVTGGVAAGSLGVGVKVNPVRLGAGAGVGAGGVTWRLGCMGPGAGAEGGLAGPTEKMRPRLCGSNGLAISSGTSTCLCVRRRAMSAGFRRASISPRGNGTNMRSRSFSGLKQSGAAWRSSPKEICTEPRESCARTFSSGMQMVRGPGSAWMSRGCSSVGRLAKMGCKGSSTPRPFWRALVGLAGTARGRNAVAVRRSGATVGWAGAASDGSWAGLSTSMRRRFRTGLKILSFMKGGSARVF